MPRTKIGKPRAEIGRAGQLVPATALAIVTLLLFLGATRNTFVAYDDPDYVTANAHILRGVTFDNIIWAFTTPAAANWHPITWLSHMLDVSCYQLEPAGHHFSSVLVHALNAAILFIALFKLTSQKWRSMTAAALFAWHPLRVESVAWVSERKDVLSGFFFMLTLFAYARYARFDAEAALGKRLSPQRVKWYAFTALWLSLGLMSKPMLVTMPFVLLLLDFWPLRRSKVGWLVVEKIPLILLAIASSLITFVVQNHAGAVAEVAGNYSLGNRLGNAVVAYARYLGKTFWPTNLAVFYPHPGAWPIGVVLSSAFGLLAITVAAVVTMRRWPYLFVGWFWFLGMLVPTIGLVQVGWQSIADRYTYLPSIGLSLALVWGAADLIALWRPAALPGGRRIAITLSAAVAIALGVVTLRQIQFWNNTLTLFTHALDVTSNNYLAHGYVGSELSARNDFAAAEQHFRDSLAIKPDNADVEANWGNLLIRQGRFAEAMTHLNTAIRLRPAYAQAHNNLGIALGKTGDMAAAEEQFAEAVRIKPDWEDARCNLALALANLGQGDEAAAQFQQALELNPKNTRARAGLAQLMGRRLESPP